MTSKASRPQPSEAERLVRNASWIARVTLVIILIAEAALVRLASLSLDWRLYALAGLVLAAGLVTCVSLVLIRRGKTSLGVWLMLGALSVVVIATNAFLVSGLGVLMGLSAVFVMIMITHLTLPIRRVRRETYFGIVVGIATVLIDLFGLRTRLAFRGDPIALFAIAAVVIVTTSTFIIRQFASLPLRGKFIMSFMLVTLIPLGLVGFLNNYFTVQRLTENANRALQMAASQTAANLDTFISTRLEELEVQAQLPNLTRYLKLPAEKRPGSTEEQDVMSLLHTFRTRDQPYVISYALLDSRGKAAASTDLFEAGENYFDRDFFQMPILDRQAYASPVEFSSPTDTAFYFSAPVQDPATQDTLGVLMMRYDAVFLKNLINAQAGLAGPSSFAMLLDENHLRLGDSSSPNLVYKTVAPLDPALAKELQAARRLPPRPAEELSTQMFGLEKGLANAATQPFFEAEADVSSSNESDESLEYVAVAPLKMRPWRVLFAQRRSVFLAPVEQETRSSLILSLVLAGLTAGAAVYVSQQIARPIIRLTDVARRITAGDLTAEAHVESRDEIGELAVVFNGMTAQMRGLISNLEEQVKQRTAQLSASAEVGRAASSILDVPKLMGTVVNLISERFGYYYTAVFMLDETGQYAVLKEATGEAGRLLKENGHRLAVNSASMVGTAITADKLRIALHAETESARYVNPLLPYTRSEIALPLRLGGRAIGALDVQSTQPNAFDEATAVVLQDMADHVAVALGNANLYTQVEQRAKQQEGLARVAALAGSTLSVDELLDRLMLEIKQLLGAEIAIALLKDENRQALTGRYVAGDDIPCPAPAEWYIPLNAPGFGQSIFARGDSYYSSQGIDDPNIIPAYLPYMKVLNVHNFCGVALRVREQSLGELYVANRPVGFGNDDVALLQTVAAYAANAIQNARLFAETQRRTVREQIIGSVTARMSESLDMDTVLKTAAREVRQALGLPEVVIRLAPPPGNGHEQSKEALL